jgi:glycosyltransferase involved in cell wall biosynthesis
VRVDGLMNGNSDGAGLPAGSFGILSTYPPTACGLATFSVALSGGLMARGADVGVVRVTDGTSTTAPNVVGELVNGSAASVGAAADLLNQFQVAVVQHEYGVYGGTDGDEVVEILGNITVPSIVIAHTVLKSPSPHQRAVLVALASLADRVVVMSKGARDRLCGTFDVDPSKVVTIPHGAAVPPRRAATASPGRPTLLTWGLVGPGKGIERVIDAMSFLHDLPERPRYLVAGQTHPKVLAAQGEAYRDERIHQAQTNGVGGSVMFDGDYRDVPSLVSLVQSCAAVVLPYDSTDQVTSGVLVDAIAAGRPVIATAFPHAVELLASGAGIVVDHDDADGLQRALRRVITDRGLAASMAAEASRLAPSLGWPVVANAYIELAGNVLAARPALV